MHKNPRVRTARLKERLLVNYVYMFKERGRGGGGEEWNIADLDYF